MDFFVLPSVRELIVLIDENSSFLVIREVKTTVAQHVTLELDEIFELLAVPSVIKVDNVPPFNGYKFTEICELNGIRHRKVTPEHLQSNGLAEAFIKLLGTTRSSRTNELGR